MSILDKDSIDMVNIEKDKCVLIITDHLEWNNEHLIILQHKINLYLHYIESEQIYTNTPEAIGKVIIIKLICKFTPEQCYISILEGIQNALSNIHVGFVYEVA